MNPGADTTVQTLSLPRRFGPFLDWAQLHKSRGDYEVVLLDAYVGYAVAWHGFTVREIDCLFRLGDREKLRAAGDPFPQGDTFTLYRGVAGSGHSRHVSGLSWTSDLDRARHFALHSVSFGCADPAVYVTTATPADVYSYVSERGEDDFIMRAKRYRRLESVGVAS